MARSRGTMAAVAVTMGALALVACDTRPQKNGAEPPATTTFQFPGPELRVHVLDRGDISIERGTEKSLEVTRHRTGGGKDRANRLALENSDLWLDDGCPETSRGICDNRYVIKVPPKANLVVAVATGDARVENVEGGLDLKVDRGDVRINQAAGKLKIIARDGDVSLTALSGGQAEVNAEHGDVRAEFSTPPAKVDFQVARGDVRVEVPAGQERYRLDVRPDKGELHSNLDSDAASERSVRVSAGAGDISLAKGQG
ncbi:DUF4097 domain-containing protein [Allokutzneria sp. A3M-2-11 16]|uniref:DUF4097 family beta strand repeat-containing protein n=1 Tax=Allokutzneria sp. A3M-2-11 16 TaxID=2962043 RepID=UPI0020B6F02E|nr:DUF4097 family beta strand repeat-containing protein [Allokutzneria sp. A3M-2-11 16]MCP3798679.1 DUF4097 domain-containing protein [Allokutzneria sp. A3M-2-11 16]